MKNLITNKSGNVNTLLLAILTIIIGFASLTVGSYLYFAFATNADAGTQNFVAESKSTGSFAFNGTNVSDPFLFNPVNVTFTYGSQVFEFEFNSTTRTSPSSNICKHNVGSCTVVGLANTNNSLGAATNLTSVINANTTLSALVTASLSGNTTVITSDIYGINGNSIVLSEDSPAFESALIVASGLSGGRQASNGSVTQSSLNNYVVITFPLFGIALMILGFGVIFVTLKGFGEKSER